MTPPFRNSRLRTSHGTVFWREVGHGKPVLLLHGSWNDSSQWRSLMAQLGQRAHCLAPDLLGFGESSRQPARAYSIAQQVEYLDAYLDHLRVAPQILIADSLGAWVAIRYCLQFPGAVKGLVIMAPEGLTHAELAQRWQILRWLMLPGFLSDLGLRLLDPLIHLLKGDLYRQRLWYWRRTLRAYPAACRFLCQRRRATIAAEGLDPVLTQLTIPVYILHPEQGSRYTRLANTLFHDLTPDAQLLSVQGDETTAWNAALPLLQPLLK